MTLMASWCFFFVEVDLSHTLALYLFVDERPTFVSPLFFLVSKLVNCTIMLQLCRAKVYHGCAWAVHSVVG
jgi:hypothetical protein